MLKSADSARSLALLSVFLALPVLAAPDAGVAAASTPPSTTAVPAVAAPAPAVPSTTTVSTVTTVTPAVAPPLMADYTPLAGGFFLVAAFFLRKKTSSTGWFHSPNGSLVIVLLSTVATSCADAIQRNGFSKNVLIVAGGQGLLTFVAMSDPKPKDKTKIAQPDEKKS